MYMDIMIHAIKNYIDGHRNKFMELHALCQRVQQQGKTFNDYLIALQELAMMCNFCLEERAQKNIKDQINKGISNGTPSNTCSDNQTSLWTEQSNQHMQSTGSHKKNKEGRSLSSHLEQSYQLSSLSTN